MHRTLIAVFTTLVLGGAALLSCSDRSGTPTEADRSLAGSTIESDIQTLINALFGKPGGLNTAANSQWKNIQKTCTKQPASLNCQTKALNLIDFTNDKLAEGQLKDPPNDPNDRVPDDTEDAALLLQLLLLEFAGFDVSGIDPEAEDLVIVVCQPGEPCLVVTPNGHSGVFLPAGACDAPCTIVGQKIDETVFFPTEGPLPTPFDQFPLFYDWRKLEAGETPPPSGLLAPSGLRLAQGSFNVPIEIALCVVEAGLYAPDPDVVAQLQLAHPDPDNADTIELLAVDPTPNVTLDCTNATAGDPPPVLTGLAPASRRLTLASPGPLGAKTSSFSPFAAVDPASGETSVTLVVDNPSLFSGGGATATTTVTPAPPNSQEPSVELILNGGTDGQQSFTRFLDDGEDRASVDCNLETDSDIDLSTGNHTLQAYFPSLEAVEADSSDVVNISCQNPTG